MKMICKNCESEFSGRKENKYCSRRCFDDARRVNLVAEKNPNWKDINATYGHKHRWIRQHYGKASECQSCGSEYMVEWSNVDHKYSRDINDYQQLCKKCHAEYDTKMFGWAVRRKCEKQV